MKGSIQFQGNLKKQNYFEGWYYKQVSYDEQSAISFIPGITLNEKDPHSFVQYIYAEENESGDPITRTGYIRYPLEAFVWNDAPFTVKIGDNLFSESLVAINLTDGDFTITGNLQLGSFTSIKRTPYMPTIMGPFSYIPKMECYHEVVSLSHLLKGNIQIAEKEVDFTGGKGYIEKDWGTNFPKQYVWLQCNHFDNPKTSVFFSDAHIPFRGGEFQGHIATFDYKDKEYRFATYLNNEIEVTHPSDKHVRVILENKAARLQLDALFEDQGHLIAPVPAGMEKAIKEGIAGKMYVAFYDKKTKEKYTDVGKMAGIEVVDE